MCIDSRLITTVFCLLICATLSVAVTCPTGWTENVHHGTCLYLSSSRLSWTNARHTCGQMNSTLVHLDSLDMFNLLVSLTGGDITWVATNDQVEEGVYRGMGGQLMTYLPWRVGQPNDHEEYTQRTQNGIIIAGDGIQDKAVSERYPYICERWPADFNTAIFEEVPEDVLQTSRLAVDVSTFWWMSSANRIECALLCRRHRPTCDAFIFSPHGECTALRVYDIFDDDVTTVPDLAGLRVYMMHG